MNYTKEQAIDMYVCTRTNNHSIPDEALDSMKDVLLAFPAVMAALELSLSRFDVMIEQDRAQGDIDFDVRDSIVTALKLAKEGAL